MQRSRSVVLRCRGVCGLQTPLLSFSFVPSYILEEQRGEVLEEHVTREQVPRKVHFRVIAFDLQDFIFYKKKSFMLPACFACSSLANQHDSLPLLSPLPLVLVLVLVLLSCPGALEACANHLRWCVGW